MVRVQYGDELFALFKRRWPDADERRVTQLSITLGGRAVLNKAAEHNVGRRKGKNNSLIELRQMNELAIKLADKLYDVGSESQQMLNKSFQLQVDGDFDIWAVMKALGALSTATAHAHSVISERSFTPAPDGKPKKFASRALAKQVADIYEEFSGQPATIHVRDGRACGPYLDLLKAVFEIIGVSASVEAAGRAAIKEKRGAKPK